MAGFIKKMNTKNKILLCVFIFSLIIFTITPIAGDDWGNYLVGKNGIIASVNNATVMYKTWEGRFISRVLISFLTYNKWLWNILNATLITLLVSTIYRYLKDKNNKTILLIPILGLLLVNVTFSSQCYLWLAGNITYFFPIPLLLLYFYFIFSNKKDNRLIVLFSILNLIAPIPSALFSMLMSDTIFPLSSSVAHK